MLFFVNFVWAKVTIGYYSFCFPLKKKNDGFTRTVLPLKKASKAKKKSVADVADVEETRTRSPELSQSDLARKKLSDLVVDGLM